MDFGTLYIVATPIGNMNDITLRAIETLKNVDLIISEDTRETSKILHHFEIEKKQLSYRDQNHVRILPTIIQELESGRNIALVSDSGTPLISDPGYKLVRYLVENKYPITAIPGPSALITALTVSGLPTDKFVFLGFLPKKPTQSAKILSRYGNLDATLVIYESPFRIKKILKQIKELLGNRKVAVTKELTKLHETVEFGDINEIIDHFEKINPKGEFVILIEKDGTR